jgi:hypothetical protein
MRALREGGGRITQIRSENEAERKHMHGMAFISKNKKCRSMHDCANEKHKMTSTSNSNKRTLVLGAQSCCRLARTRILLCRVRRLPALRVSVRGGQSGGERGVLALESVHALWCVGEDGGRGVGGWVGVGGRRE